MIETKEIKEILLKAGVSDGFDVNYIAPRLDEIVHREIIEERRSKGIEKFKTEVDKIIKYLWDKDLLTSVANTDKFRLFLEEEFGKIFPGLIVCIIHKEEN